MGSHSDSDADDEIKQQQREERQRLEDKRREVGQETIERFKSSTSSNLYTANRSNPANFNSEG